MERASDGKEALKKIERLRPSVVVTDWILPQMDGQELVEVLRDGPCSRTPVIVLTSLAGGSAAPSPSDESNIVGVLEKPLNVASLLSLLSAHAGRAR